MDLLELNEKQREAVLKTEGPVMCIAGAGTGKTRVLTYRIAHLVDKGIYKNNIVAVTFTNKAANEMKERIAQLINDDTSDMWVSTFHSFCLRILRQEITEWHRYKKGFQIIDEEDTLKVAKKALEALKLGDVKNDEISPKTLLNLISQDKNQEKLVFTSPYQKSVYESVKPLYDEELLVNNVMDFDDIIVNTITYLNENPSELKYYKDYFKYILVDEFQDTNYLQYQLIKLLTNDNKNVFVVGDQDQSIYSFRGAKVGNIKTFMDDFPEYELIKLEENYRSNPHILNLANKVISQNKDRIDKNLFTSKTDGEKPILTICKTDNSEIDFIFREIIKLTRSGYKYSDITILYRSNYLSRNFETTFKRYKIPYQIVGGISYFARKEVKDILSYLRLAINTNDNFSFERIINVPARKITKATVDKIFIESIGYEKSLFDAIDYIEPSQVTPACMQSLMNFKNIINQIKTFVSNPANDTKNVIDLILEITDYRKLLTKKEDEDKLLNVLELKNVIREAMKTYEGTVLEKLSKMLEDCVLATSLDNLEDTTDKVKLMTYHQAKGLEFPAVFMMATEDGVFPNGFVTKVSDIEEERRICYVGVTRAKERLFITCAQKRFSYGRISFNKPSMFIANIDENILPRQKQI